MAKRMLILLVTGLVIVACGDSDENGRGPGDTDRGATTEVSTGVEEGSPEAAALEAAIEQGSEGRRAAAADGEKVQLGASDGSGKATISPTGAGKIPAAFPKDIPTWSGAKVIMAAEEDGGFVLVLSTADDPKTVVSGVRKQLAAEGWKEGESFDMGGNAVLRFEKGDRGVMFSIQKVAGQTQIRIGVDEG